ncbi:transposase [Ahrensia sp. 13_GOM-1096m]|uniref:IS110 family transposase n=1 Tax=Ahrensia sp. 13_GOM-1096m TaxID=1380380 RepID=UPI000A6A7064|nr:transposase [Ahrensia sp. 13_GOM-1096m]
MINEKDFVGLDVGKFEIFVFIGTSATAFSVSNTPSGYALIQNKIGKPGAQIIALEPTGSYEWGVWETLDRAEYDVRQISVAHVRAFARATGALAKTDPIDARLITKFMAFRPDSGRKLPAKKLHILNALSSKHRQMVEVRKCVKC